MERDNELIKILKQLEGSIEYIQRDRGNDETLSDVDDDEDEDYCPNSPKRSRPSSPMRSTRSYAESKTKRISLEVPIDLVARTTLVASDIKISLSQQTKLLTSVILASKRVSVPGLHCTELLCCTATTKQADCNRNTKTRI